MKGLKWTKGKLAAIVAAGCMAAAVPVLAFDMTYNYAIGPNETRRITKFVPAASTIYLNTRPTAGGDVTITLSGAANSFSVFPYYTSRADWKVTGVSVNTTLYIDGTASSSGAAGNLHVWSN